MAWTSPRTWVSGEVPTAAILNTHIRDNFKAIGDPWVAWVPSITASSGTFTTTSASGRYMGAGKLIFWSLGITITTVGTASNYVQFSLPTTAQSTSGYIGGGRTSAGQHAQVSLVNATTARVSKYDDVSIIGAGVSVLLSGFFEAA